MNTTVAPALPTRKPFTEPKPQRSPLPSPVERPAPSPLLPPLPNNPVLPRPKG